MGQAARMGLDLSSRELPIPRETAAESETSGLCACCRFCIRPLPAQRSLVLPRWLTVLTAHGVCFWANSGVFGSRLFYKESVMKLFRGVALSSVAFLLSLAVAQPALAQQNTNKASKEDNGIGIGVEGMVFFPNVSNVGGELRQQDGIRLRSVDRWQQERPVGFTGEFIYKSSKIESTDWSELRDAPCARDSGVVPHQLRSQDQERRVGLRHPRFGLHYRCQRLTERRASTGANFNSADYGLMAGLGVEFYRIGIEGRGNWGFKSITPMAAACSRTRRPTASSSSASSGSTGPGRTQS